MSAAPGTSRSHHDVGETPIEQMALDRSQASTVVARVVISMDCLLASVRRQLDVNPNERQALEYLFEHGPMPMSEIAERLGISRAATTTLVDNLVEVDYVTRGGDERDRRVTMIRLSDHGRERGVQVLRPWLTRVQAQLDELDDAEWQVAARVLCGLYRSSETECTDMPGIGAPRGNC